MYMFTIIIYKQFIYFKFLTQKKIILTLVMLSFSVLVVNQAIRIIKNYENNYQNYPWPKYFSYSQTNEKIKTVPININGKLIEILDQGNKVAGYYTIVWNAQYVPSGTYFIRFSTSTYNATQKVSLIK